MREKTFKPRPKNSIGMFACTFLIVLLLAPVSAAARLTQTFDPLYVYGYSALVSIMTYRLYRQDKRAALANERRTPESTLHLAEFLGGWPGAFVAQRVLRHKIVKISYQIAFWCIIALYELVSFDFLRGWEYSRKVLSLL